MVEEAVALGVLAPYSLADDLTVDCRRLPPTVAEVYTLAVMLALHRRYPQLRYPPPPPSLIPPSLLPQVCPRAPVQQVPASRLASTDTSCSVQSSVSACWLCSMRR